MTTPMMITADEVQATSPPRDIPAYLAGYRHQVERGMHGPDMETEWKRHGRKVPRKGAESEKVILERDFPKNTASWEDHWDFASWSQGLFEAQFGVDRGYGTRVV